MSLVECLRAFLAVPVSESSEPGELQAIEAQVRELAHAAFVDGEPGARGQAERLLHLIHVRSGFAAPVQQVPAMAWNILVRAKLESSLRWRSAKQIGADEMRDHLERGVRAADAEDHDILDQVAAHENIRGLIIYTKNWFGSTNGFTEQLIALSQRCNNMVRHVVVRNLVDELEGTTHEALRVRYLEHIGLRYDATRAHEDPDLLTEAFSVLNLRTALSSLSNPSFALGSFYSIEAIFPMVCRRLVSGLRKRGFPDQPIEIFGTHVETDEDHAAEWLDILEKATLSPQERGWVVEGARAQLAIRHELFAAMRAYIHHTWEAARP